MPDHHGDPGATGPRCSSSASTTPGVRRWPPALLAHHAGDRVVVRSAGTAPADDINPAVVEAMAEIGIDLHRPAPTPSDSTEAAVQASDVVITMGCGDECPFFPGTRYLDWQLDDPAGQGVDAVRPIRDEIDRRVLALRRGAAARL